MPGGGRYGVFRKSLASPLCVFSASALAAWSTGERGSSSSAPTITTIDDDGAAAATSNPLCPPTILSSFLTPFELSALLRSCRRLPTSSPPPDLLPATASPSKGRIHCELTSLFHTDWWRPDCENDSDLRRALVSVEERASRVSSSFFSSSSVRPRMTQLQLLDSLPGSDEQFWHCDNTARGVTFVIALEDVDEASGPTELLLGTEECHDPRTGEFLFSACADKLLSAGMMGLGGGGGGGGDGGDGGGGTNDGVNFHRAVIRAGDAFVFDSRTLHRGGANRSSTSRPVAIIRYDPSDHPPPGCGSVSTSLLKICGKMFEVVALGRGNPRKSGGASAGSDGEH